MLTALFHGIILAFGLILPLGAQNVFIFNQGALQPNFKRAIPMIITASLCDTLLILLAVLGVSVIVFTIPVLQTLLFSIGLLFLLYMGWTIWKSNPGNISRETAALSPRKQIMFATSVSLLNPHAILDTIGVIGTSSLSYTGAERALFTLSCIVISWIWFFCLAIAGRTVGNIDKSGKFLALLNKISAIIIWSVAAYIAVKLYQLF
ncbi:LysE/ArgO family amino acid transporter [Lederbergia lenta]|uniref:LysE family L-lysine exporter n=1 Tax=Lederbergia lenta TaxID=1467 RepID=A0A2X4VH11_LEDLE|nr:LysE/ArgO family amino acid transporter [Lederbergia lenta]MCM3112717.1 LysE/ArgO family amino acid transporter [Lederbergia lenta]MEC2323750.1 LysE/ArgO family amino acid transporter [Lederbergia lenta]SQI51516.1 LysE family L-lysine exporter [Lederbergia lenta]